MNVWAFDAEPKLQAKKTSFVNEVEVVSTSGWGDDTTSQRRKQRGEVEFLVEDHQASDDDGDEDHHRKGLSSVPEVTSHKTNEVSSANIVETVDNAGDTAKLAQTPGSRQTRQIREEPTPAKSNQEITVHHLVREFLLMHSHEEVVKILDQERPMPLLDATAFKKLNRRLTGTEASSGDSSVPLSLLERFLVCSNEAKLKARAKRSSKERSASTEMKSSTTASSSSRSRPVLKVITNDLDKIAVTTANTIPPADQTVCGYNRLNHPGSTPHHQTEGVVIGEPGSTPMAHTKYVGFEDVDDDGNTAPGSVFTNEDGVDSECGDQLSLYAVRKRTARTGLKRVDFGNAGSTPTKEYVFFRETPPSFLTETLEGAVEVFEKLANDPEFAKQAAVVDRFIELQSSEVSKYSVGQAIDGLGTQSNIGGVVSKIYGSRLCGTAGPGTIVIDIWTEECAPSSTD